jgi:hypothetical protein
MAYSIIQPPFTLVFREMTKPELKRYQIRPSCAAEMGSRP